MRPSARSGVFQTILLAQSEYGQRPITKAGLYIAERDALDAAEIELTQAGTHERNGHDLPCAGIDGGAGHLRQTDTMYEAGYKPIFKDKVSDANAERQGLSPVLKFLPDWDVQIMWRLHGLGLATPPSMLPCKLQVQPSTDIPCSHL